VDGYSGFESPLERLLSWIWNAEFLKTAVHA
jgi:hypothetical protein